MSRVITRYTSLGKLFPGKPSKHAALANLAFRLCVFREDMLLEISLMSKEKVEGIDRHDEWPRKIYATRRAAITLIGACDAMHGQAANDFVRNGRARRTIGVFVKHRRIVKRTAEKLRDARNQWGAHIDEEIIQPVLDKQPQFEGRIAISNRYLHKTSYDLPVHAMLGCFSAGVTTDEEGELGFKGVLENMHAAHMAALEALDNFFFAYATEIEWRELAK